MKNLIKQWVKQYRLTARAKRRAIFRNYFPVDAHTKILDLGSEDGSSIYFLLDGLSYNPKNIYIADIDRDLISAGAVRYGFTPVYLKEDKALPFGDRFFDIVYCSSVIEHVTVPKDEVYKILSGNRFSLLSSSHQEAFANELARVGKGYFVQTPNKYFIVESHTWLPFFGFIPRRLQVPLIKWTNRFWVKKTAPDFHLLSRSEFQKLFPESLIIPEKSMGMVKSWMAIRKINQ